MQVIFIFIVLVFGFVSQAQALVRMNFYGLVNETRPKVSSSNADSYSPNNGLGLGLSLNATLTPALALEVGANYLQRKYKRNLLTFNREFSEEAFQIPVLMRGYFLGIFSVGLGGYYNYYQGNVKYDVVSNGVASASVSNSRTGYRSTSDYGAMAALGVDIPLSPISGLMVDTRYLFGLHNNAINGSALKFDEWQLLVGLRFGISK